MDAAEKQAAENADTIVNNALNEAAMKKLTLSVGITKKIEAGTQVELICYFNKGIGNVALYPEPDKTAITAADILNDRVIPFYDKHNIPILRILTDRGTEYCGKPENHAFQL